MGISFSIPPWVIQETNNGLEMELMRAAFAVNGYEVIPSYLPLARTLMAFQEGSLDGVINVRKGMLEGYYSDVVVTFHNLAVTLKENNLQIDSLSDLRHKSIVAFQRASTLLGNEFGRTVAFNSDYNEVADQSLQVKQLFKGRTEVIVLEKKIFQYFHRRLFNRSLELKERFILSEAELRKPIVYHNIFPPTDYRFAFLSRQVRDDFNAGLRAIKASGDYDRIIRENQQDMEIPPL